MLFRCLLLALSLLSTNAFARIAYDPEKPSLFYVGGGIFDVTRKHPMGQYHFEYRSWRQWITNLRPLAGIMWTQKGSVYLYGGLSYDIYLGNRFVLTPSFAPGIYFNGGGKNLHYPLEFRSCMEASFVLKNRGRLGAMFYHISNASLGKKNPGTECLEFYIAFPLTNQI